MSLAGQRILVVGGGSGIGFAVARAAIFEGAQVVIASTNGDRLAEAGRLLGPEADTEVLDITREPEVAAFFASSGTFDHVATTAGDWGGPWAASISALDLSAARALFDVRFWGALTLAKHAARVLPPGGSLTLTDGMVSQAPRLGGAVSGAMAGAVEHLARGLAVDLAPLRVNAVAPGFVETAVWNARIPEERRAAEFDRLTARQLIPRMGRPQEIAEAYLYLMKAGFTTGQVLYVEGGLALA